MRRIPVIVPALLAAILAAPAVAADNQLTDEEKKAGWQLLFNGKDHTGWKCNTGQKIAAPIEDGALIPWKSGGYLVVYEKPFSDFILRCDVKMIQPECNSGIFFRIGDLNNPIYTGLELQVLTGKGAGYHDFGGIFDIVKPVKNATKGPDQWDTVELKCHGPHISVKVNGELVTEMDCDALDKPGLRADGSKHKFGVAIKDLPRKGYFGFQDHGQKVWYKNVKLLDLSATSKAKGDGAN